MDVCRSSSLANLHALRSLGVLLNNICLRTIIIITKDCQVLREDRVIGTYSLLLVRRLSHLSSCRISRDKNHFSQDNYRKSSIKPPGAYLILGLKKGGLLERGLNREGD